MHHSWGIYYVFKRCVATFRTNYLMYTMRSKFMFYHREVLKEEKGANFIGFDVTGGKMYDNTSRKVCWLIPQI